MSRRASSKTPAETPRALAALDHYLRSGPQRSLRATAKAIGHKDPRHVMRWSVRFSWAQRAADYDAQQRELYREKAATKIEELAERHVQIAKAGLAIAARTLQKTMQEVEQGGKGASLDQAIRLIRECSKLERLALGEATDRHEVKAEVRQEEPEIPFRDLMRDPETRALLDALAKAQDG